MTPATPTPGPTEPADGGDGSSNVAALSQRIGFWLGLAAFGLLQFVVRLDPERDSISSAAAVAALMAIWWMTEAFPLAVTALVPIVLFPLLGLMPAAEVAPAYIDSNIFLFGGGFILALAMERWNLHRRIALLVLLATGDRPSRIVLGFMLATGLLSMWVSNTATAMMMLPMGISLASLFDSASRARLAGGREADPRSANFPLVLMLGIAYAASIGGMGTIIGTPPNVVFISIFHSEFPSAPAISFAQWMLFAAPLSVVFLVLSWLLLTRLIFPLPPAGPFSGHDYIRAEYRGLGPVTREEAGVAGVFTITALLWIFRKEISLGPSFTIPGWSTLIPHGSSFDDGTIAMLAAFTLFILPASRTRGGGGLMDWATARKLPWEILILFGGGFALARGLTVSGLSDWLGAHLEFLQSAPPWLMMLAMCSTITFSGELSSNTAVTQMILPVLSSLARTLQIHPLFLMVPATLAASVGFMLPVATPPNAIVFSSGFVPIRKMIRAGLLLNLLGIALIVIFALTVAIPIFGITPGAFPDWAAAPPAAP